MRVGGEGGRSGDPPLAAALVDEGVWETGPGGEEIYGAGILRLGERGEVVHHGILAVADAVKFVSDCSHQ